MPRWAIAAVTALLLLAVGVSGWLVLDGSDGGDAASPAAPAASPTAAVTPTPGAPTTAPAPPRPTGTRTPCLPAGTEPVALTVLTFNIHGAVDRRNDYDLDQVADEIRSWAPDVVLVQEIHRFRPLSGFDEQPAVLARKLGMDHAFGQNFSRRPKVEGYPRRRTGTAVLSRFPLISHENTALPNRPGLEQRGLLRATLDVDGHAVDVYNTHLQPGGGDIRVLQVSAIDRIVRDRASRTGHPYLLGGDFNSEPGSAPMLLAASFTTDPWPRVGVGVGETVRPREPRFRVDYLLHGPGWDATRARTLLSLVSDHRALRVRLVLDPAAGCGVPQD